jgi:hypothetical protein
VEKNSPKYAFTRNISKLLFFVLIVAASDQIIGKFLEYLYFNQKTGQEYSLTYVLSYVKTDVLIFGNSRAQHHYDPQILTDSLQMSCYNAGQDGGHSIMLPDAQLKIILKRYTPKLIILEFDPFSLEYSDLDYEVLSILLPYKEKFPELKSLLLKRGHFERIKQISAIYPYNSRAINLVRFNTISYAIQKHDIEGYVPILNKDMDTLALHQLISVSTNKKTVRHILDENKLNALLDFINLCKQNGIRLYIINSPLFRFKESNSTFVTESYTNSMKIIQEKGVFFIDFSNDPYFFGRKDLFADELHLNDIGARIFTTKVAQILNNQNFFGDDFL